MNSTSSIVNHIQKFTSQRDNELIAYSLMQSVQDMLSPHFQSIVTLSRSGHICRQFVLKRGQGTCLIENFEIDPKFDESIEYMEDNALTEYVLRTESGYTLYYLINATRKESKYFVLSTEIKLAKVQLYLLSGMFNIFKNYNELLNDAQTDQLTGLLNRKTFESSINRYWEQNVHSYNGVEKRADFEEGSSWVAIIDIDHFKNINDTYGHLFGDEILILVSNILKKSFRSDDLLFRFGGEEFVVLMRNLTEADCFNKLNEIRNTIEEYDFPKVGSVTISAGACMFFGDLFYMTILDYADKALFESKSKGRNQVTIYETSQIQTAQIIDDGDVDLF
jgi:diguanylate cyclase (GGDEF)-like protein